MALFDLAGNVFGGGSNIDAERLGFDVDGNMPQGAIRGLEDLRNFPGTVSQNLALEERNKTGRLSLSAFFVAEIARSRSQQRASLTQIQSTLVQDKVGSMKAAQATAQLEARFGSEIIKHNFLVQAEGQTLQGMQAALSNVSSYV